MRGNSTGKYGAKNVKNSQSRKRGSSRKSSKNGKRGQQDEVQKRAIYITIAGVVILIAVLFGVFGIKYFMKSKDAMTLEKGQEGHVGYRVNGHTKQVPQPDLDVQLLTVNDFSRPGIPTDEITGVVVHYLANPGSTAQENRDYFESLKDLQDAHLSSNFVVGLEGEIVQCIPTAEIAYASNTRNNDTVSIECCHPDESGKFNEGTYEALVELTAFLCGKYDLTTDQIIRHYDVTGKICPKYYVENEDKWEEFKQDVASYIEKYGVPQEG